MPHIIIRGKVRNAQERRARDERGEKLETLRKSSLAATRASGKISGPFQVRDWEK